VPRLQAKYQSEMFLTDFNRPSDAQEAYARTDVSLRYEAQPGAGGASRDFREWRARSSTRPERTECARSIASNGTGWICPMDGAEKRGLGSHQDDVPNLRP
jgi:hypothetical protein